MILAILLSGLGFYLSFYFHAIWWVAWIAPIPLMMYSYKNSMIRTLIASIIVSLMPGLNNLIGYLHTVIPISIQIIDCLEFALIYTLIFMLNRWLVLRYKIFFAFPMLITISEYLQTHTIFGTFNTISNSQLKFLPTLQLASLGGYLTLSFIMSLFAACIAYFLVYRKKTPRIAVTALSLCIVSVLGTLTYGFMRLHTNQNSQSLRVALISIPMKISTLLDTKNALHIANYYKKYIVKAAHAGAKITELPEESFVVTPTNRTNLLAFFKQLAHHYHLYLIIGVREVMKAHHYNAAWLINSKGEFVANYRKRHFVPNVETGLTPGKRIVTFNLDGHRLGIAICRDMDYPNPSRIYAHAGIDALFVPAWDMGVDRWVHANGAIMRGVENGYTVIRDARYGYLSASTKTGKLLAIKDDRFKPTLLIVDAPITRQARKT